MTEPVDTLRLWKDIVRATPEAHSIATALRVPLLICLLDPEPERRHQTRDALAAARAFLSVRRRQIPSFDGGRALFCFAHSTPSNLDNLLPVAREALRQGMLGGIVAGEVLQSELREFAGVVPIVSIRDVVDRVAYGERLRIGRQVLKVQSDIRTFLTQIRPDLASSIAAKTTRILRLALESVQMARACETLLDAWSPSCVVSTSDFFPFEHHLCREAATRGISSFVIQHGVVGEFWWPFVASTYLLWGNVDLEQMLDLGAPRRRLAVTGMPATDKMFRRVPNAKARPTDPERRPVCLILSNTQGASSEPLVFQKLGEFLPEAISLLPQFEWKVKLHPIEGKSFYRNLGHSTFEHLSFFPKQTSLMEAVLDADVVLSLYSTSGLEAMIMDRPVVIAPATERVRTLVPWPDRGGGSYALSAAEFAHHALELISDEGSREIHLGAQRRFLEEHFANVGRSTERICEYIGNCQGSPSVFNRVE